MMKYDTYHHMMDSHPFEQAQHRDKQPNQLIRNKNVIFWSEKGIYYNKTVNF
jgi:hypothetical protein